MALLATSPAVRAGAIPYLLETRKIRHSITVRLLGACLFVCLDIIIDPVALRGSRWFLGQLYGYPEPGFYFGVPLSNFAGWFVVGFVLIWTLQAIDMAVEMKLRRDWYGCRCTWRHLTGPCLYLGVLLFNLSVTFYIGEHLLAWTGVFITVVLGSLFYFLLKANLYRGRLESALKAHLADFPDAACPDPARVTAAF